MDYARVYDHIKGQAMGFIAKQETIPHRFWTFYTFGGIVWFLSGFANLFEPAKPEVNGRDSGPIPSTSTVISHNLVLDFSVSLNIENKRIGGDVVPPSPLA
jgi:hypothetical protein